MLIFSRLFSTLFWGKSPAYALQLYSTECDGVLSVAGAPGHNGNGNRYPHSCCTTVHGFYSSFRLTTNQHHGYCWKQGVSCIAATYREVSSSQRRKCVNGRRSIPMGDSARLRSQRGLTGFDVVENGNVPVSDLSPSVWGVVVFSHWKNPIFFLVSINNWSRLRAENCQLLDQNGHKCSEIRCLLGCWGHCWCTF